MTSPDPDPQNTPGLEPGGGVQPGDTPPGEASTTAAISHQAARVLPFVALGAIGVLVLAIVVFFIARVVDLM
jgi:hypothetical protein